MSLCNNGVQLLKQMVNSDLQVVRFLTVFKMRILVLKNCTQYMLDSACLLPISMWYICYYIAITSQRYLF